MNRIFCSVLVLATLAALVQAQPKPSGIMAQIALVSDTHTTRGTNEEQPLYRGRLAKVIAAVNAAKVDLVLIAGDLTEHGRPEELNDFKEQIKAFEPPVWYVPGHHDLGNKIVPGKETENELTPVRLAGFETLCGPSFFARECLGFRIIGFNSPILGSGFPRENEMWRFLEQELGERSSKPVLVFTHYPPFVKNPGEAGEYFNIEPGPRRRLLQLLKDSKVSTYLSGHLHRPLTNHIDGMLLLTTGPVSFGLPRGQQPQGWTLVTVPAQGEARAEYRAIAD